ncbi:phosphotransferase [Ramlibacter sp. G-1-2-2]|uniref:Phosphotransferase n=1 Tax=Ramlibacter agri TaxID=2728837 RepID=A0A848GXY9_9BURK|nr:phosphotransferase [Ramlibacter agri]NML42281.1 phosphotransferase [Ramlibacter agri]
MQTAHTILAGEAIAQALRGQPALGEIESCALLRRGFNEVYELRSSTGRYVARLAALRARGPSNVAWELAFLAHLESCGASVAGGVAGPIRLALPEGQRDLAVFRHVEGSWPESEEDYALTGEELGRIHAAGASLDGPPSRYTIDLEHLVTHPLQWLGESPTMDAALVDDFHALAQEVRKRIGDARGLEHVTCHGDCHGGNNYIAAQRATFFDFDDAGPGWLAYDLAVLLWGQVPRRADPALEAEAAGKFKQFLAGYRRVRPVADADLAAVPAMMVARHIWLLGEYASRRHHWGTQAIPTVWLRKQVPLMRSWLELRL